MKYISVTIALDNQFFDINDYEDPIHSVFDNEYQWNLLPGVELQNYLRLRVNEADDHESIFYPGTKTNMEYYSIGDVKSNHVSESPTGIVFRATVSLDYTYSYTERRLYNFYDCLSNIGGFIGAVVPLATVFVKIFANNIFKMMLVRKLYKVEDNGSSNQKIQDTYSKEDKRSRYKQSSKSCSQRNFKLKEESKGHQNELEEDLSFDNERNAKNNSLINRIKHQLHIQKWF